MIHAKSYLCIDLENAIMTLRNSNGEDIKIFNDNTKIKSAFSFQQKNYSFIDVLLENDFEPISLNENIHGFILNSAERSKCGLDFNGTFGNDQLYLIDTNLIDHQEIPIDIVGFMTNLTIDIF